MLSFSIYNFFSFFFFSVRVKSENRYRGRNNRGILRTIHKPYRSADLRLVSFFVIEILSFRVDVNWIALYGVSTVCLCVFFCFLCLLTPLSTGNRPQIIKPTSEYYQKIRIQSVRWGGNFSHFFVVSLGCGCGGGLQNIYEHNSDPRKPNNILFV